jgi:hypothetical protein
MKLTKRAIRRANDDLNSENEALLDILDGTDGYITSLENQVAELEERNDTLFSTAAAAFDAGIEVTSDFIEATLEADRLSQRIEELESGLRTAVDGFNTVNQVLSLWQEGRKDEADAALVAAFERLGTTPPDSIIRH